MRQWEPGWADAGDGHHGSVLRVLHIEDNPDDAALVGRALEAGGWQPRCKVVATATAMRQALASETWDLVISDYGLPHFGAPSALSVLHEYDVDIPLIIVSGTITEEAAVAAMKAGASDYVTKGNLRRLVPAVQRELRQVASREKRARGEHVLEHAEARFRTLVESLDGLVFTVDNQLRIDGVSGRGLDDQPIDPSRYHGMRMDALFADQLGARDLSSCARAFGGETVIEEWTHEAPLGTQHLRLSLAPIVVEGDVITGLVGLVRDVTEPRRLQAQLAQSDRLATIGALVDTVGHEIRSPLAVLMSNLDILSKRLASRRDDPQIEVSLTDMQEAAERIKQMVRDLQVGSRPTEDTRTAVDVEEAIESSLRMAGPELRHRARLIRDFEPVPPVLASEARLGQVLVNLLVNAAQAIPPGDPGAHEVRISTRRHDSTWVAIEIRDTGEGMSAEVKQRLFTPYFSTKPEGKGSGIGLSICERIVTGLGGYISVASESGKGSSFRVILPAATGTPDTARPVAKMAPPPRRGRVLVVDDEPMLRRTMQRALAEVHDVEVAKDGRCACARIEGGERFDVIFCDLLMPEMTGVEVYATLTALAPEQAERIVFITGGILSEGMRAFLDSVGNRTLVKPFDSSALLDVVAERQRAELPDPPPVHG